MPKEKPANGKKKGVVPFMLLLICAVILFAIVTLGVHFNWIFKIANIQGKVNLIMINDDVGTELVSLLNAKTSDVKHIELLGRFAVESYRYDYLDPVHTTLDTAFKSGYDFSFQIPTRPELKLSNGAPPSITASQKAIKDCGATPHRDDVDGKDENGEIRLAWPASSKMIKSGFGGRELSWKKGICDCHGGIDINPEGDEVYPAGPGKVFKVGTGCKETKGIEDKDNLRCNGGLGNYIIIEHPAEKFGHVYYSYYLHLREVHVQEGAVINPGDVGKKVIARPGSTGNSPEGPHLHFELRNAEREKDKNSIDPCPFFKGVATTGLSCEHEKEDVCKYVSGANVMDYDTDVPLPGAKSGNVKGIVVFKQWD